jgi:hypothetical protein
MDGIFAHRRRRLHALGLLLALVLAGCTDSSPKADDATSPSPSAASSPARSATPSTAAPPPTPPRAGACYALSFTAATAVSADAAPVPCSRPHTAVTMYVGSADIIEDGHLITMDSARVADHLSTVCPRRLAAYVGGDREDRRLARLQAVWFTPTAEQAQQGAVWFRCDLVALAGNDRLVPLPRQARGMLDRAGMLDRYGTCGTAAPDQRSFHRVACAERHTWRAVTSIDLPPRARYLDKDVTATADARCKDIAASRASNSLKYSWSFEWPARKAWRSGQHWGLCWLPVR